MKKPQNPKLFLEDQECPVALQRRMHPQILVSILPRPLRPHEKSRQVESAMSKKSRQVESEIARERKKRVPPYRARRRRG